MPEANQQSQDRGIKLENGGFKRENFARSENASLHTIAYPAPGPIAVSSSPWRNRLFWRFGHQPVQHRSQKLTEEVVRLVVFPSTISHGNRWTLVQ